MRVLLALLCMSSIGVFSAAQAQDRAALAEREAMTLQKITRDPRHPHLLSLGDGAPFPQNRDQFDAAFAACRRALKAAPGSTAVRVNLGALYLWRDALHPDESGNFEKAVDQLLIVLAKDPANEAALAYLRSHEVLTRIRPHLGEKGTASVRSALQRALKDSPRAPNLRAFAWTLFFDGKLAEARAAAKTLVERAPEPSSHLLLAAVELKAGDSEKALAGFQTVLKATQDPLEMATASLGSAQAFNALADTDAADRLLGEAARLLPPPALEHAAQVARLITPAELGWSIGKAYAAAGNAGKASGYLGAEGMKWLSAEAAFARNQEAVSLFRANKMVESLNAFFASAQLDPRPVVWGNAAFTAFQMGRYQECVLASRRGRALEPLGPGGDSRLAIAYAVLGDYKTASATFERAAQDAPGDKALNEWTVALTYAIGGWDEAVATWSRLGNARRPRWDQWYEVFIQVRGALGYIAELAERRGARYQSLRHESILYRALGEGLKRRFLKPDGLELIRRERQETLNKIIDNYRRLPLKPALPSEVQELLLKARPLVESAFKGHDSFRKTLALYEEVVERAPWFPEGHYMLALMASQDPGPYTDGESHPDSRRELNAYLALVPEGPEAARALKVLEAAPRPLPFFGPDIENDK